MAFWCLLALSYAVYATHERCMISYSAMARQVQREQCYWAAVGGVQRVASHLVSLKTPKTVLREPPAWFGRDWRPPPKGHPARLQGAYFKICRRAYSSKPSDYTVEDEAGRININNCPDSNPPEEYVNRGGKPSTVLVNLLSQVDPSLTNGANPEDVESAITAEIESRIQAQRRQAGSGRETFESEDVFRHPFDLFTIPGFEKSFYFGEDFNENNILDPNEDDNSDYRTFPDDNGNGVLDEGIRNLVTVWSNRKFNVYGTDDRTLRIMLSDFEGMYNVISGDDAQTRHPNPISLMSKAQPPLNDEEKRWFRAFRAKYLTLTDKLETVRITVQAYQNDGTWRGCIEQIFAIETEDKGGGARKERYLRPLFKYYR